MNRLLIFLSGILLSGYSWAQTLEYKTTMLNGNQQITSTSKRFYANGNIRTEVNVTVPGMGKPMKQTALILANKPRTLYMLNETARTFSEASVPNTDKPSDSKFTVKLIGKEKVSNLNCTHAEVTFDKGTMEVWTTKEIPGYAGMQAFIRANQNLENNHLYNELRKNGIDGLFVRMSTSTRQGEMLTELERYDNRPVPLSMFRIPKDFKKVDLAQMRTGNVSESDRKKFLDEMQKRQKSRP